LAVLHSRITVIDDTCRTSAVSVHAEAAEKAELDYFCLAWCPLCQRVQGIVERHEIAGAIGAHDGGGVDRDMFGARAAFHVAPPRVIDEDAAHRLRRNGQEMSTVLPVHALVINETHVGFVDQCCRLQAVAGAFTSHVVTRQSSELVVHDRHQPGERVLVSAAPRTEQRADFVPNRFAGARGRTHCAGEVYAPSPAGTEHLQSGSTDW
jgi:hypothetical protein